MAVIAIDILIKTKLYTAKMKHKKSVSTLMRDEIVDSVSESGLMCNNTCYSISKRKGMIVAFKISLLYVKFLFTSTYIPLTTFLKRVYV